MQIITSLIRYLRLYSLLLFLIPLIALLGSLLLLNHLQTFNSYYYPLGTTEAKTYECTYENKYCENIYQRIKFHECSKYVIRQGYIFNGILIDQFTPWSESVDEKYLKLIEERKTINYAVSSPNYDQIDYHCIKNSLFYPIYEKFPPAEKLFFKIKEKTFFGTSQAVYPFLYGETSISNIVKRYPASYLFKPLLYLSSLLMVVYWINYKRIFSKIEKTNNEKKIEFFLIFGILSSFFLFLHVLFLGTDIDSSIFQKFRRLNIALFIFFELTAQFFLAKRIFVLKEMLLDYTYKVFIYLKITFVAAILLITTVALSILFFLDPGQTFNNILEWNYFCFLLIFYLLSALMWRKNKKE